MVEDEINNMNKTCYRNFHTYTEAKHTSVLAEEINSSKKNRISESKNSKDNSSGAANTSRRKNTSREITTLLLIKFRP